MLHYARVEQRIRDAKIFGQRAVIDLAKRWDDPDFSMEQKKAAIARTLSAVIAPPYTRADALTDGGRLDGL